MPFIIIYITYKKIFKKSISTARKCIGHECVLWLPTNLPLQRVIDIIMRSYETINGKVDDHLMVTLSVSHKFME